MTDLNQYRLSLYEQCQMFRVLSAMIRASIGFTDSLELMEKSEGNARVSQVYSRIHILLAQGHSLSNALSKASPSFSTKTISIMRIGEETGGMVTCLDALAQDLEARYSTMREVKSTLTYPVVVTTLAIVSFGALFTYLVPQMLELLEALDAEVPTGLAMALTIYQFLTKPLVLFVISQICLGLFLYWRKVRANPNFELRRDHFITYLPLVGSLSLQINAFQFSRGLYTMMEVGCPVVNALKLLAPTLSNAHYRHILQETLHDVSHQGLTISESMKARGLFDAPFHQMLASGEESGKNAEILLVLSEFYRQRCRDTLAIMTALLEPTVLLCLGVMVCCLVLGFFLPLMNVIGNL